MKIAVAQTRSVRGDVDTNITSHQKLIDQAASLGVSLVIFPELSLTGYEPTLAAGLATSIDDKRFDVFQTLADSKQIIIGTGMPIQTGSGINISMILFRPGKQRAVYSKYFLHSDEDPFFVVGENLRDLTVSGEPVALAICYEISIPEHTVSAFEKGAKIFVASVAKSVRGIDKAHQTLSDIARQHKALVLMSNCAGTCDGDVCPGRSAAWNENGERIAQLNDSEGILVVNTQTLAVETLSVQ
jgi:predicted amidohydrolase